MPNTCATVHWMRRYFAEFGENIPNSNLDITFQSLAKIDIYAEYFEDIGEFYVDHPILSYHRFCEVWRITFPNVRTKSYKHVCGKCSICALLSDARRKYRDNYRRQLLGKLFTYHRSMYMNERLSYYDRKRESLSDPKLVMSIILDGMSQNHCILPWMANKKEFGAALTQHLQGVLNHGRR